MYITVRKSFSKQRYSSECDRDFSEDKASVRTKHIKDQRKSDSETIEKYRAQSESDRDTISILESKVEKAERELYDYIASNKISINNKLEEIKVLKGALKNKDDEIMRNKKRNIQIF